MSQDYENGLRHVVELSTTPYIGRAVRLKGLASLVRISISGVQDSMLQVHSLIWMWEQRLVADLAGLSKISASTMYNIGAIPLLALFPCQFKHGEVKSDWQFQRKPPPFGMSTGVYLQHSIPYR